MSYIAQVFCLSVGILVGRSTVLGKYSGHYTPVAHF